MCMRKRNDRWHAPRPNARSGVRTVAGLMNPKRRCLASFGALAASDSWSIPTAPLHGVPPVHGPNRVLVGSLRSRRESVFTVMTIGFQGARSVPMASVMPASANATGRPRISRSPGNDTLRCSKRAVRCARSLLAVRGPWQSITITPRDAFGDCSAITTTVFSGCSRGSPIYRRSGGI